MLLSSRDLRSLRHIVTPMTLAEIRAGLRDARRARKKNGLTLAKLEAQSGVDRAVIHRIESVEKYERYAVRMETVSRLVDGMGLTLASFFLQLEASVEGHAAMRRATDAIAASYQAEEDQLIQYDQHADLGKRPTASSVQSDTLPNAENSSVPSDSAALRAAIAEIRELTAELRDATVAVLTAGAKPRRQTTIARATTPRKPARARKGG